MKIAIGSLNPVKRLAAEKVLGALYPGARFLALDSPSGVSTQPWGDEETRMGALNRARFALTQREVQMAVGLEGGLVKTELGIMTCAWCAVISADGHLGVGGGAHMMLPPQAASLLEQGIELGAVMDEITGMHNTKHALGAIGLMTGGLETRESAYAHILRLAMAPFQQRAFFEETHTP